MILAKILRILKLEPNDKIIVFNNILLMTNAMVNIFEGDLCYA